MRVTVKEAHDNKRNLSVIPEGFGHWKIECDHRGKRISTITCNSLSVDDWKSDPDDMDGRVNRKKQGYEALVYEIIQDNKPKK